MAGNLLLPGVTVAYALSAATSVIPLIFGFSNSVPGSGAPRVAERYARGVRTASDYLRNIADSMGLEANFERREQGWKFNRQQAENELAEIEKQIEAAEIRRDISAESRRIHEQTLEQSEETFEFYRDKFTNLGLYTWMSTQLQRLYREAYQNAITVARLAERAYRFERSDDTTALLDGNYWDGTHAGLLAGEQLMNDLRTMERLYMETHYRSLEIDQAFSLSQIDPLALIQLKETGECNFSIPEFYFDLYYPGHYRRRPQICPTHDSLHHRPLH